MTRTTSLLLATLACWLALPLEAGAQIVGGVWETHQQAGGAWAGDQQGYSVSDAGDVNGDGVPDLIVGAPLADPLGLADAGVARVLSGATGSPIWCFSGGVAGDRFGWSVAGAGDVDLDGFADLIVGAPYAAPPGGIGATGSVYVLSGATGNLIWRFDGSADGDELGNTVDGCGDIDGDGVADLIAGARGTASYAGAAYVYSGATGMVIHAYYGQASPDELGVSVARVEDVDGDGTGDFIIGEYGTNGYAGAAILYSGASGSPILRWDGSGRINFGRSVDGAGDVDGDMVPDVIIGTNAKVAYVYSGATGALLYTFSETVVYSSIARVVAGAGDVDGDGTPDLVVGAPGRTPGSSPGYVRLYSGRTGDLLHVLQGNAGDCLGNSVSGAGDLDSDGRADVIAGAHEADPGGLVDAGNAIAFGFDPCLQVAPPTVNSTTGGTVSFLVDFPDSEAFLPWVLLASTTGTSPTTLSGVEIPLTDDWLFQLMINGQAPPPLNGAGGTLDSQGNGSFDAVIPAGARIGSYYFAAVSYIPPNVARLSSAAVTVEIL